MECERPADPKQDLLDLLARRKALRREVEACGAAICELEDRLERDDPEWFAAYIPTRFRDGRPDPRDVAARIKHRHSGGLDRD